MPTVVSGYNPIWAFKDNNGNPLVGGQLFCYIAGTTTKQAVYTDSTGTVQNTNPVILNVRGETATSNGTSCGMWLLPSTAYKFVLAPANDTDPPTSPIDSIDVITAPYSSSGSASIIPTIDNTFTLGNSSFSWANVYVGANHAPVLDTVSGNIGYYKQTAAESAASVTPTNYAYPFGWLKRYGGASGAGDNTSAMNQATSALNAAGGGVIVIDTVGEWRMNWVCAANNIKVQGPGGGFQTDTNMIRPFNLASPAMTFGDGTNNYYGCGLMNCQVSGTDGTSQAAAHCAPQALLINGGMIGFTTDARCMFYTGIQTVALVPSATKPVTQSRIEGVIRNDCPDSASARAIYQIRKAGGGYNTDNKFIGVKVNSVGIGYAAEIDGTAVSMTFLLCAGGYWDIKPGLGILLKGSGTGVSSEGTQLDPGTTGVVVLETNDTTTNLAHFITGLLIADNQQWKNGTPTTFNIPLYSQFYSYGQAIEVPFVVGATTFTDSTDIFGAGGTRPVLDKDTAAGPLILKNSDFSVKTVGNGLRVATGTNAKAGLSNTMSGGTVTVSTTAVTANSMILLTRQEGNTNPGAVYVSTRTAGTSFVITSTNASDTGRVAWVLIEPA